jgi:catechol 2,3-dioxygenase-like lactoylglutathione lyase family enzyme
MNLPPLRGIHHIKLSVSDLDRSEAFLTLPDCRLAVSEAHQ